MTARRASPPSLPWDVLLVVLELSDAPSLSRLSQVCVDFLIVCGPRLYHSINLKNLQQLGELFCESTLPSSSSSSRIQPYLSLSQMHHLTIDFGHSSSLAALPPSSSKHLRSLPNLSSSRLPPPFPHHHQLIPYLPLETLQILLNSQTKAILNPLQTVLFPLLNPRSVAFVCSSSSSSSSGLALFSDLGELPSEPQSTLNSWTYLKNISFQGIVPFRYLGGNCYIASLPRESLSALQALRFHVGGSKKGSWFPRKSAKDFLEHWMGNAKAFGLENGRERALVFVVEREAMREELFSDLVKRYPDWMERVGVEVKGGK
ncbi:hypothetical protein BDY24DRAFT_379636 [Mrakia frigida]|uniref:uncharacterized protein n=1 Tax=Mrakia frigida TaxID=29902 RepID=UPI003FCC234F